MLASTMTSAAGRAQPRTATRRVLAVLRWPLGGIRTYTLYHYPTLLRAGYRFTFVGPAHKVFRDFLDEARGWPGTDSVEAPHEGHSCSLWPTVRRLLRSGRFDMVHSHGLIAAAHTSFANLGVGVPHVVTSHDVFRKDQMPGLAGKLKLWGLGKLLGRADSIVSVSRDAQDNLLEYIPGLARARCRLTPVLNGIDVSRFAEAAPGDDLRARLGIGPDVFLMGFLGRFMEQKGFLPLLHALQLVRDSGTEPFHLLAVGSGDYQREYAAAAEQLGVADCISFVPFVPDVAPVLRQLDLMVMPSLWESCGLLAMEAMVAGTPVLGSDCVGLREVLRDTPSVMSPTGDVPALAAALRQAIASPWTAAAREFAPVARERFRAEVAAEKLRQVFDEVLERGRGS